MPAAGGATWRLRLPVHLRAGAFKVWSRAIDTAGNVETKRRSGNFRRMRAR
jgi:hypothetical protein